MTATSVFLILKLKRGIWPARLKKKHSFFLLFPFEEPPFSPFRGKKGVLRRGKAKDGH
jgi:hypothetical protein